MVDVLTKKQRSYNMSMIKGKDTKPEIALRRHLYKQGIRGYRLNYKISGRPDITFPKYKVAVFVDGCFWHMCPKCFKEPENNKQFWLTKIKGNVERDKKTNLALRKQAWKVIRLPEHKINKEPEKCINEIRFALKKRGYYDT